MKLDVVLIELLMLEYINIIFMMMKEEKYMNYEGVSLYEVKEDVRCLKCGHKGAIQSYGKWYPRGLGDRAEKLPAPYNKYKDQPKMSQAMGFGGTIPWKCTNCGNTGLIDFGGLEGYDMAFKTIKENILNDAVQEVIEEIDKRYGTHFSDKE